MKTRLIILIISFLYFFQAEACKPVRNENTLKSPNSKISDSDSIKSFTIVINNYYFGRVRVQTILTADSLETTHDDLNGKKTSEARPLRSDETKKMKQLLSGFPLERLEEKYINDRVKDGINIGFDISINSSHKRIFVSNYYQDDLGKLVDVIRPMLKEDYIGYQEEYFQKN